MANVTDKELKVLNYIRKVMDEQDGFSNVLFDELEDGIGFDTRTLKGVLGSLEKKKLIMLDDVNGEYNVYYVSTKGFGVLGYTPEYHTYS